MKFAILDSVTDEQKKWLQNKKVCDVVEMVMPSPMGYYKGWTGSVEEAWFSIVFVKGILTISLEEREMLVGKKPINYACIDSLIGVLSPPANKAKRITVELYNSKFYIEDLKLVTFKDIMKALKWKFASRKVEVQEHFLSVSLTNPEDMV